MRPAAAGKGVRMTFSRQKEVLEMPNLIEIQKNSYQWFLNEGLREVFADISPIADFAIFSASLYFSCAFDALLKKINKQKNKNLYMCIFKTIFL